MPGIGIPDIDPIRIAVVLASLLVALTVHEASHAWMAVRLGDPTPRALGRLTLNPLAHLDPLGTIMMVYTTIFGFGLGWAKPVPVNPYRFQGNPRTGMALVSIAGPAANLLTATLFSIVVGLLGGFEAYMRGSINDYGLILNLIAINIIIAIFNLIPIPPLDGFHALLGVLPRASANALAPLEQYGPFLLLAVIFFGMGILGRILEFFETPILRALVQLAALVSHTIGR